MSRKHKRPQILKQIEGEKVISMKEARERFRTIMGSQRMRDLVARSNIVKKRDLTKDERRAKIEELFKPYIPPPGVLPKDAKPMAMDTAFTPGMGDWAANSIGIYWKEGLTFLGYAYLSELTLRPEYRVISQVIATEMTRKWIKFESTAEDSGDEEDAGEAEDKAADPKPKKKKKGTAKPNPNSKSNNEKTEKINELTAEMDRLCVRDVFYKIAEMDGWMGRAHLYIDTGDGDNPEELMTDIGDGNNDVSIAKMKKGKLQGLRLIEPVWTYPQYYNSTDPLKPDWYLPSQWFVMGKQLSSSRLLTFIGRPVPDILKPAYAFGGLSLSQIAKPYVDNWLQTRQSVNDIIHAFSVMVLMTDMAALMNEEGDQLLARLDLFNNFRDNRGVFAINKETEEFKNVSAPLGTLDQLQAQAQEHMASVSRIPIVKLLGISPHGLNASSEGELKTFYDTINAFQEFFFRPNLTRVIHFIMLSLWGKIDEDITFKFEDLWAMTEKEAAEIEKTRAETGDILINGSQAITPEEERTRIANSANSQYDGIDPSDVPDPSEMPNAGEGGKLALGGHTAFGKGSAPGGGGFGGGKDEALKKKSISEQFYDSLASDDYDPNEPRVGKGSPEGGEWTSSGGSSGAGGYQPHPHETFVSPNVGNLNFAQAHENLSSHRQAALVQASLDVDKLLGKQPSHQTGVIGAWKDGAENSIMMDMPQWSHNEARAAAAMKGWLADQKSVLVFEDDPKSMKYLASWPMKGDIEKIHQDLLNDGLEFHTLEPTSEGATVHVYGDGQETIDKIKKAAGDTKVDIKFGNGEFIGTTKDTGSDREQRDDARKQYEAIINEAGSAPELAGRNLDRGWASLRANWGRNLSQVTAETGYRSGVKSNDSIKESKAIKGNWIKESPIHNIEEAKQIVPQAQEMLGDAGRFIEQMIPGVRFKDPGSKLKSEKGVARVLDKAKQRGGNVAAVSDLARCAFIVKSPSQADDVIKMLGQHFEVTAEPWKETNVGYMDRAANVRLPNGVIGEVQIMDDRMEWAKSPDGGGGHDWYKVAREAAPTGVKPDPTRYLEALLKSRQIYQKVLDNYPPEWKAAVGSSASDPNS